MRARLITIIPLIVAAACAGRISAPALPPDLPAYRSNTSIVRIGRFTEYTIPAGVRPTSVSTNNSDTIWFAACNGASAAMYSLQAHTGTVTAFTPPSQYTASQCSIAQDGAALFYALQDISEYQRDLARVTMSGGTFNFFDLPSDANGGVTPHVSNIVVGPNATLWLARSYPGSSVYDPSTWSSAVSISTSGTLGASATLGYAWAQPFQQGRCCAVGYFQAMAAAFGGGSDLYVTARSPRQSNFFIYPGFTRSMAAVYKISAAGAVLARFTWTNSPCSQGSSLTTCTGPPLSITAGPDGNVWIADAAQNKILRMTPGGAFTAFTVPTANAELGGIVSAPDGALWFTETAADKIGRISTTGNISEIPVPASGSQPTGISACSVFVCVAHGGVWFAQTATNEVGRYDFP